jgi:hypothetical protein
MKQAQILSPEEARNWDQQEPRRRNSPFGYVDPSTIHMSPPMNGRGLYRKPQAMPTTKQGYSEPAWLGFVIVTFVVVPILIALGWFAFGLVLQPVGNSLLTGIAATIVTIIAVCVMWPIVPAILGICILFWLSAWAWESWQRAIIRDELNRHSGR